MKTIIAAISLLCFVAFAEAQNFQKYSGAQTTAYTGGTNKAVALSTNTLFNIDVPKSENVTFYCAYKYLNAPGAGDVNQIRLDLYRGIDSGVYETNIWQSLTIPGNSTTSTAWQTNLALGAVGYLRASIVNVSTNAHATNVVFKYGFKN